MVKTRFAFTGDDRDVVPFYLLPKLGGNFELRGFSQYRFYDNNAFMATLEHRWYAFTGLEMAAFLDAGKTVANKGQIDFSGLNYSGGIGFRARIQDAIVLRMDVARSREGFQVDLEHQRRLTEAILMPVPRPGTSLLFVILLVLLLWPGTSAAQKFFPDDPLNREPTPFPAVDPGKRNLSLLLETAAATFGHPGERHPANGVIAAQGLNSLGEVMDGAWYVNRHGRTRLSLDELRRGAGDAAPPSTDGAWRVLLIRSQSARPTIVFRDSRNDIYLLRFDPAEAPELATGADMIASRFFHALGYRVPETYLVSFERKPARHRNQRQRHHLLWRTSEPAVRGHRSPAQPVARRRDGTYRAVALRLPPESASLIGPFQMFGTRSDDPNDVVPHEHRRELRGLQVFSAWLNHTRMDPLHTFDIVVEPPGQPRHIRHYLFDFMGALGSGVTGPKRRGRDESRSTGRHDHQNIAGIGIYSPAWIRADYPGHSSVGRFDSKTFEPETWTPVYDVAPFANRLPDDTFWAARQVMAFTDEEIRAIVRSAQYSDPAAEKWIADCLIERRDKIGRAYFPRVLPLDSFATEGGQLTFVDRGVQFGILAAAFIQLRVAAVRQQDRQAHDANWNGEHGSGDSGRCAECCGGNLCHHTRDRSRCTSRMVVNVYMRSEPSGLRVVGLDHEWPGRTLVEPRVVTAPTVNRYAALEPERQLLFVTYVRALNTRTDKPFHPSSDSAR